MQLKFRYNGFDYLSVKSLEENAMLKTDALHFALQHEVMKLAEAALVNPNAITILHGDMVAKLSNVNYQLTATEANELREAGFSDFVIMPLIKDLHITLAILHRAVESDTLHIMDSLAADDERDTLHESIALNFLQSSKRVDGRGLNTVHSETASTAECMLPASSPCISHIFEMAINQR